MHVESLRWYICGLCKTPCLICTHCDRGQRYCGKTCAASVRKQHQYESRRVYWRSFKGRRMAAARQQRRRLRAAKRVTYQGPAIVLAARTVASPMAPVTTDAAVAARISHAISSQPFRCSFCASAQKPVKKGTCLTENLIKPEINQLVGFY